jgi:hypothetical protein
VNGGDGFREQSRFSPVSPSEGGLLFVNKKKQKDFLSLGRAGFAATGPAKQKVFCAAFFQKSGCFLFPGEAITLWTPAAPHSTYALTVAPFRAHRCVTADIHMKA